MLPESIPQEALVVILSQDQEIGIGAQTLPDVADRNPCSAAASGPDVRAECTLPELEGAVRDAQMGVDLQGASLDTQRSRLYRRTGMAVYDARPNAAARQLIREHQPGWAGSNDQDVSVQGSSQAWGGC
jgi:hypothetical protein